MLHCRKADKRSPAQKQGLFDRITWFGDGSDAAHFKFGCMRETNNTKFTRVSESLRAWSPNDLQEPGLLPAPCMGSCVQI